MSDLWYTPRLTTPSTTDLNWIKTTYGGYNPCILGYPSYATGSVLANCVGYAWGRWREILGYYHNLYTGNGGSWYGHTSDGYSRGSTPQLGCVGCWGGGGVDGHVAIIEEIYYTSGGAIDHCIVSESAYGSTPYFRLRSINPYNNWWIYNNVGTFQGFIYLPVDFLPAPIIGSNKRIKVVIR